MLITNLMHWLLFIHKIIFSSTCFEPQVLIFRRIQLYCHSHREWQYHMLHVHNCILLKMRTWGSKHVRENIILRINNNQCIKLVINIEFVVQVTYEQRLLTFKSKRDSKERTVVLKKLITLNLINTFPAVCGTRTLLAIFTVAGLWSLSGCRRILFTRPLVILEDTF